MKVTTVGLDLAKNVFQVHGVDDHGKAALKKQLKRSQVAEFFANLVPARAALRFAQGAIGESGVAQTHRRGVRALVAASARCPVPCRRHSCLVEQLTTSYGLRPLAQVRRLIIRRCHVPGGGRLWLGGSSLDFDLWPRQPRPGTDHAPTVSPVQVAARPWVRR